MVVIHPYHLIQRIPMHYRILLQPIHSLMMTKRMLMNYHLLINHPINLQHPQVVHHLIQVVAEYLFVLFMIMMHKNQMNYHSNKVLSKFSSFVIHLFFLGDILTKLEDEDDQGWCKGRVAGRVGLYPATYVESL